MRDQEPRDENGQSTLSHWSRPPQTVKVRRFLLQNCLSSVPVNICLFAGLTTLPLVWSYTDCWYRLDWMLAALLHLFRLLRHIS